jgi:hypothetical protein
VSRPETDGERREPTGDRRDDLADAFVREDPQLASEEKETGLWFGKRDDRIEIRTDEYGLGSRLLRHPWIRTEYVTILGGGYARRRRRPDRVDATADELVGVTASFPVGLLKIARTPRGSSQHAQIVSQAAGTEGGLNE